MGYRLTGSKCGTVRFDPDTGTINKESLTRSSKITENAIEDGGSINDHVIRNPEQFSIGGILIGGNAQAERLTKMWKERDLITYTGRIRGDNLVITNLVITPDYKNKDGCSFTATLQKANIASSAYVEMGESLMSQEDSAEESNQSGQTASTKNTGLTTPVSETITENAYMEYVNSYNGNSSSGPSSRKSAGYDGVR